MASVRCLMTNGLVFECFMILLELNFAACHLTNFLISYFSRIINSTLVDCFFFSMNWQNLLEHFFYSFLLIKIFLPTRQELTFPFSFAVICFSLQFVLLCSSDGCNDDVDFNNGNDVLYFPFSIRLFSMLNIFTLNSEKRTGSKNWSQNGVIPDEEPIICNWKFLSFISSRL